MELLDEGHYNWLHAATHGNFYPGSPETDSAIWLQDMHAFAPDDLVGFAVEDHIKNHRPGFFFNACHSGRGGWALNRIGGWANRLVSAGASFFVGPLWIVSDHTALTFAEVFYQHLLAGEKVAEAIRQGRLAVRSAGDPAWLAYSVYAHPDAQVVFRK